MYETVLIPTDGSDHAVRAAEHCLYLARAFDATVHLLSVVDVRGAGGIFDAGGVGDEFVDRLEADAEKSIEVVEAVVEGTDSVRTATTRGEPSEAILEYASEHDVDLIGMGTHGRTGVQRYVAGSVTEQVVRRSDVPVLTARATDRSRRSGDYDDVLVPTDGSDPATAAVDHAIAIAREAGARVHAISVVDLGNLTTHPDYSPPPAILERFRAAGEEATASVADRAREAGLDAVTEVREGFPARDVLEYADDAGVDLIAMGTTGRTGLNRYLLGSTTERVIRHAEMPVLAVNARGRAAD